MYYIIILLILIIILCLLIYYFFKKLIDIQTLFLLPYDEFTIIKLGDGAESLNQEYFELLEQIKILNKNFNEIEKEINELEMDNIKLNRELLNIENTNDLLTKSIEEQKKILDQLTLLNYQTDSEIDFVNYTSVLIKVYSLQYLTNEIKEFEKSSI